MLRNAFEYLATEATLANVLTALASVFRVRKPAPTPVTWDGADLNVSDFEEVEFGFGAMTGGPWTPQRRLTASAVWQDWPVKDSSDVLVTSIAATDVGKIYRMRARGHIRLNAASGTLDGRIQEA